jgi:Asp/Glu/hydantoin racemase
LKRPARRIFEYKNIVDDVLKQLRKAASRPTVEGVDAATQRALQVGRSHAIIESPCSGNCMHSDSIAVMGDLIYMPGWRSRSATTTVSQRSERRWVGAGWR